jgi:hypothetical protein
MKLQDRLGKGLDVFIIDVTKQAEYASHWNIDLVLATILIEPTGELLHINCGIVRAETLLLQMYGIEIPYPTNHIQ